MRIGYACLNQTLSEKKISVNRGMVRRTFQEKGIQYAGELIIKNLQDLSRIIEWNATHGISFYRMSSNMFPWMSEYEIQELPQFKTIEALLSEAGRLAQQYDQRLTFHPGPFNVLASANDEVVTKTIKELNQHAEIMDLMRLDRTPFNKINIHIGTTLQGDKLLAMQNFCNNFPRLNEGVRLRLTVENDDKPNMYSTEDLYKGIHEQIGIPLVFDFHHHLCHPADLIQEDALRLALRSWPSGIRPVAHYSEPKSMEDKKLIRAHSDFIEREILTYGLMFDIMIEAKQKECALLRYKELEESDNLGAPITPSLLRQAVNTTP